MLKLMVIVMAWDAGYSQKTVLPVCEMEEENGGPAMCLIDYIDNKFELLPEIVSASMGGNSSEVLREITRSTATFVSTTSNILTTAESLHDDLTTEIRNAQSIVDSLNDFNTGVTNAISAMNNVQNACNNIRANGIPATCTCAGSGSGGSGQSQILTCDSHLPRDCQEVKYLGNTQSGIYTIYPVSLDQGLRVYCDMVTDNDAWIVFQRRQDGTVNFTQNWNTYKNGFGELEGEFWLGNKYLAALTATRSYTLRIDMRTFEWITTSATYGFFRVENEASKFRLRLDDYTIGNAGDRFVGHNGKAFSTVDVDNDDDADRNCAVQYKGGWWFNGNLMHCSQASLNNPYVHGGTVEPFTGISYDGNYGGRKILQFTEIKIK